MTAPGGSMTVSRRTARTTATQSVTVRVLGLTREDLQLLQACIRFQARQQHDRDIRGRLLRLSNKLAALKGTA